MSGAQDGYFLIINDREGLAVALARNSPGRVENKRKLAEQRRGPGGYSGSSVAPIDPTCRSRFFLSGPLDGIALYKDSKSRLGANNGMSKLAQVATYDLDGESEHMAGYNTSVV